jgi:hypothetical protein
MNSKCGLSIKKKTKMASFSGSVAILKISWITNFHINMISGNQKVSNERAT